MQLEIATTHEQILRSLCLSCEEHLPHTVDVHTETF